MGRLDDITLEELHELREKVEGDVPRGRVLAAIARKQGDEIQRIAERHDVWPKTISNWLDRFAEQPIEEAPYDEPRSGAPGRLTDEEKEQLFADFHTPPTELEYERQAWTSSLAVHHISEKFDVEYSKRHARYLMEQAELSWRTARPRHYEADPEEEEEFQETVQKNAKQ
jgi:transposase